MIVWSAVLPWKPPSTNTSYLRSYNGRMFMPKEVTDYKKNVAKVARYTYSGEVLTCNLKTEIVICFKDNRRRDISNHIKALLDCLEGIVYKNDTQLVDIHIIKGNEKEDSVTIKIWTV